MCDFFFDLILLYRVLGTYRDKKKGSSFRSKFMKHETLSHAFKQLAFSWFFFFFFLFISAQTCGLNISAGRICMTILKWCLAPTY